MNKRVVILHNRISESPLPDELDVLDQVELVRASLTELGFECLIRDVGLNLYEDLMQVRQLSPLFVFNLVETVFSQSGLLHLVPSILTAWQISYTGVSDEGLFLTTRKSLAKQIMRRGGIGTPDWFSLAETPELISQQKKYIIKPVSEEGSVRLDEDAVFRGDDEQIKEKIAELDLQDYFVEEFIDGREFNLSVTGSPGNYRVYPVAEMIFRDFPEGKERMLGYRAKWDEQSFEYRNTIRQFDTLAAEPGLHDALVRAALRCGEVFRLSGYFRVDFRVPADGQPLVLEINGNPCIAPDSGFIAAVLQGGMTVNEVIGDIAKLLNGNRAKSEEHGT